MRERATPEALDEPRFLIDNSVWARLSTSAAVVDALQALIATSSPSAIYICPPTAAEYGYSARSGPDHTLLAARLEAFTDCPRAPSSEDVLRIQNALWNGGLLRAVGALDTLIAAYGIVNAATVVHCDRDFEHVAAVTPGFQHRWIVPRGRL